MNNGTTFAKALASGYGTGVQLARDTLEREEREIERAAMKKRFESQQTAEQMRIDIAKRQLEGDIEGRRDERSRRAMAEMNAGQDRRERMMQGVQTEAWRRDATNPANQAQVAHAKLAEAQATALREKPVSPRLAEMREIRELRQQAEDQLIVAQQSGDPRAIRKAQVDVQLAERAFDSVLKVKDDNGHVEEEVDGSGRVISRRVKRPYDPAKDGQAPTANTPATGGAGMPSPKTKTERDALPPGTKYRYTDGQIYIRP